MSRYSNLLDKAAAAIANAFQKRNVPNLLSGRGGKPVSEQQQISSANDFELVTWLVIL